jgi:hypothetical protein
VRSGKIGNDDVRAEVAEAARSSEPKSRRSSGHEHPLFEFCHHSPFVVINASLPSHSGQSVWEPPPHDVDRDVVTVEESGGGDDAIREPVMVKPVRGIITWLSYCYHWMYNSWISKYIHLILRLLEKPSFIGFLIGEW